MEPIAPSGRKLAPNDLPEVSNPLWQPPMGNHSPNPQCNQSLALTALGQRATVWLERYRSTGFAPSTSLGCVHALKMTHKRFVSSPSAPPENSHILLKLRIPQRAGPVQMASSRIFIWQRHTQPHGRVDARLASTIESVTEG